MTKTKFYTHAIWIGAGVVARKGAQFTICFYDGKTAQWFDSYPN